MIKKIITILLIHLSFTQGLCVCPVNEIVQLSTIEKQIKEQLNPVADKILFNKTPSGFVISIKDNLIFDENNCITNAGKEILETLAQTIKTSGRRWLILSHTENGKDQLERLYKTSINANLISAFLIEKENCLINQIFPIGFGAIMPNKFVTTNFQEMHERTDFIVEDFSLN